MSVVDNEQRRQVAERVREARAARGWSQAALADAAEVSENTVVSIERGDRNNQAGKVRAVLAVLGVAYEQAEVLDLEGVPEDVKLLLTVALQRLRVIEDPDARARILADVYPRLLGA